MNRYLLFVLICFPLSLWAASSLAQITLNITSGIHFGQYEYDSSHSGTIRMGTDGNITIVGGSGVSYVSGTASPGTVAVSGSPQDVIELKCEPGGRIQIQSNGRNLNVREMEIAADVGVPFGNAAHCTGTGRRRAPALVIDLATNPNPIILMGGEIRLGNNRLASGTHFASNPGGDTLRLRVVFQ